MKAKKFAAAVLAATLAVSSMPMSSLADLKSEEEAWWTVETGKYENATTYFANGNPVIISEKGGKTYMYRDEDAADESKWVTLDLTGSDKSILVVSGAASEDKAVSSGKIVMKSGNVGGLIGSIGAAGEMDLVEITVEGGSIKGGITIVEPIKPFPASFAACDTRYVEKGIININGGSVGTFARGTFSYSKVDDLEINVTGGEIGKDSTGASLFAGSNGMVGKCVLNVSGGTLKGDVFVSQRALVDEYVLNFTGGEIKGGIFPGSAYSDIDNADATNDWGSWGIGSVNYGVANSSTIKISGDAKYTDIFASFQNIEKDVKKFNEKYSGNTYNTLNEYFKFNSLNTSTEIVLGVQPGGKPVSGYDKCVSLTGNELDGVTVVTPPISIELDQSSKELQLGESLDIKASLKKISSTVATDSNATIKWESSDSSLLQIIEDDADNTKAKAEVIGYKLGAGTVTVTASLEGDFEIPSATCIVKITEPKLSVSVSPSSIAYDGEAKVAAKLENVKLASPSNAEFSYEAAAPAEVDGDGVVSSDGTGAFGKAKITVEASYGGNMIAADSTEITIKQPEMRIISDASTIDLIETDQLNLEVESGCQYEDYVWTVDDISIAEIDGVMDAATLTAKKAGTVVVTVTGVPGADLEDVEGAKATRKITIKDSRKLAWKGEAKESVDLYINNAEKNDSAKLEILNDYGASKWMVADNAIAKVVPAEDGKSAVLTAMAAGTTTLTVTAEDTEKELVLTVNVYNAGKLAWAEEQEGPVQLYLNNEEKSDTATLNIVNDFANANWSLSNDEVAEITVSEDGMKAAVTGKAAGTTTLTVTAEGTDVELTLTILVVDSAENVEVVGGETEVTVPDEVIENAEIPEIDTEGLTDEQKQYIEENKAAIEASVKEEVKKAAESIAQNAAAKAIAPTGLDAALRAAGILEDGEKATVYLNQEVKEIQVATTTIVGEDGTVTVKPVITGMVFDITPHLASVDENGKKIEGTEQNVADAINTANKTITLSIPVPADVAFNYAKIQHQGSTTTARIMKTDNGNYIRTSVRHFSEFVITFTNEAPYTGGGGGSARSGSVKTYVPVEPGQWILNETGWWYKYDNGTYPAAQWVQLPWNGVNTWYYFDAQGYLATGWLQDGAHTYYLHPAADGNRGYMYTGWHQIDGKWYYFHTMEGGPLGAMAVNTTTPDGFAVGADGVWVQ